MPYVGLRGASPAPRRWTRSSPRSCWPPPGCRWATTSCCATRSGAVRADPALLTAADRERLGLPVFVKPARAGSSIGITRVTDWARPARAPSRPRPRSTPRCSSRPPSPAARSSAACWTARRRAARGQRAGGDPAAAGHRLVRLRRQVPRRRRRVRRARPTCAGADRGGAARWPARRYQALDCAGWPGSTSSSAPTPGPRPLVVNEVNTMPGFTPISMFPRMWAASGVDLPRAGRPARRPRARRGRPAVTRGRPVRRTPRGLRPARPGRCRRPDAGCDDPVAGAAVAGGPPPPLPDRAGRAGGRCWSTDVPSGPAPAARRRAAAAGGGEDGRRTSPATPTTRPRERAVLDDYGYRVRLGAVLGRRGRRADQRLRRTSCARGPAPPPTPATSPPTTPSTTRACLAENPPDLPGGCWLLTVEDPPAGSGTRRPGRDLLVRARASSASR